MTRLVRGKRSCGLPPTQGSRLTRTLEGFEPLLRREFAPMGRALAVVTGDWGPAADAVRGRIRTSPPALSGSVPIVVTLSYVLDQATLAIADTLDITDATVRLHLGSARLQLVDAADFLRRAQFSDAHDSAVAAHRLVQRVDRALGRG